MKLAFNVIMLFTRLTTSRKSRPPKQRHERHERHQKSKKSRKRSGLTQYDAEGNVIRARVTYGGLSDSGENDWSPKHRTRQKKINYTEMPNTESEDVSMPYHHSLVSLLTAIAN